MLLLAALLTTGAASRHVPSAPPRPARPVPERDSIAAWEIARDWVRVDSASTAWIGQMERDVVPDTLMLAYAHHQRANARWSMRRLRDGKGYADAVRAASLQECVVPRGTPFSAGARLTASRIAMFVLQYARAESLCHVVVGWAAGQEPVDSSLVADAEHLMGTACQAQSRPIDAMAAYDRAWRWMPASLRDSSRGVPLLSDRALLNSELGEIDAAEADLLRALALSEGAGPRSDLPENVLSRLSTVQLRTGNLAASVESARRSFAAARRRVGVDNVSTLFARVRLMNRLMEFDDFRGALAEQRDLVPALARALGESHPTTINVRLGQAEAWMETGQRDSAALQVERARVAMRSQPPSASSNPFYLRLLDARLAMAVGEFARARDTLALAIQRATAHDGTGELGATCLIAYLASIRTPQDAEVLQRAIQWVDLLADSTTLRRLPNWFELIAARALAERRVGLGAEAWHHAQEAERLAYARTVQEVRALPDARALQLMDRHGAVLDALIATLPTTPGAAAEAWDRLARWRGLVRDEIARRRPVSGQSSDTALVAAHERWSRQQRRLARLAVSGAAHPEDPQSAWRWSEARAEAEDAERAFARLTRRPPVAEGAGIREAMSALAAGEALVGFALAGDGADERRIVAFVARSGGQEPRVFALGDADELAATIANWIERLATPPGADARGAEARCRAAGEQVRARVWAPIEPALAGARRVYVVPVAALEDLPWLALPAARGRYLAESDLEVRVIASEADLARAPDLAARTTALLAVGDPEFGAEVDTGPPAAGDSTRAGRASQPCLRSLPRLGPLPAARAEAREIAAHWPDPSTTRVLVGADAREADVKRLAPGRLVLHLATHGIVIGDDCDGDAAVGSRARGVGAVTPVKPKRAAARPAATTTRTEARPTPSPWLGRRVWLALAGANVHADSARDENDGLLTAEEVVTLDLRGTDWVVLSACQSGAHEGWSREGVLGMRRAFHLAGAEAVIASRWSVADEATRAWMLALYAARAHTHSASAAVREASRAMLAERRAKRASTHPFWWAAFSASGD